MGAGLLNCAIYGIARFYVLAVKCIGSDFPGGLLIFFGLASMLVATPFIIAQRNYRRLLAYSSIEHAGIMVAAIGLGGPLAMLGAALHMFFHALTKPLLFFCAGNLQQHYGTPYSRKVTGAIIAMPLTGALLIAVVLAVTAVPPFGLFQSEFIILAGALAANHAGAAALFLLCVVAIFAGFLRHVVNLTLGEPPNAAPEAVSWWKNGAMLGSIAVIAVSGLFLPGPLFKLAKAAADILGGIL
jgi:hydrogenase-4 component F